MFGYVTVNRPEMKVKELELYRSYYCGLCHALHERYGRKGQMLLSYDGTFLAILLTGLYEPKETERMVRCLVHPAVRHKETSNRYVRYAADMNVLLAYVKAVDDWRDERKPSSRALAMLLHGDYCRIRDRYPRQERALAKNIRLLHRMEKQGMDKAGEAQSRDVGSGTDRLCAVLARIEKAAGYTGAFLAEMCVPHRDLWERDLRKTGFYLGKFIYLIDAFDDLETDAKKGNYNPLILLKELDGEHFEAILKEILLDTAACCCRGFERLPIIRNVELLRNILYSGIWVRFHQVQKKKNGKQTSTDVDHQRELHERPV